jgi:hypothetical protein
MGFRFGDPQISDLESGCRAQVEQHLRQIAATNLARPLFVPAYGVDNYVDMADSMQKRLQGDGFEVVGVQDFAVLGRAAALLKTG